MKQVMKSLAMMLMAILLFGCIGQTTISAAAADQENKDFTVVVESGYDGKVESGAYAPFSITVTNAGKDFTGSVQIIVPESGKSIMYEKDISIGAGTSKTVIINVRAVSPANKVNVRIMNTSDRVVWSKQIKYTPISSIDSVNIGVLSDDFGALSYMDGQIISNTEIKTKIMELKTDTLSEDWKALDMIDVIVISNFSTDQLTQGQISALSGFVKNGGYLIVGTGSTASKTLSKLNGTMINVSVDELVKVTTKFGLSTYDGVNAFGDADGYNYYYTDDYDSVAAQSGQNNVAAALAAPYVEANVTPVNLTGATDTGYGEKESNGGTFALYQTVASGEGYISTVAVDFTQNPMPSYAGSSLFILDLIESTIDETLLNKINQYGGYYSWNGYDDNLESVYGQISAAGVPSLLLYSALILAYLVAIPVVYAIFRKKKQVRKLWIVIPVISVGFSGIIFLCGLTTRLISPSINVANIQVLRDGFLDETSAVAITLPSAKNYTIGFDNTYDLKKYEGVDYYSYYMNDGNLDYDNYTIGYNTTADTNNVEIKNSVAMSSEYFKLETSQSTTKELTTDLYYISYAMSGTIVNNLGCDLEDAYLFIDDKLYKIGALAAGETYDMSKATYVDNTYYWNYESEYDKILTGKPDVVMSVLFGNNSNAFKAYGSKMALYQYTCSVYMSGNTSQSKGLLCGFPVEEQRSLQLDGKYKEYSTSLIMKNVPVSNSKEGYVVRDYNSMDITVLNENMDSIFFYGDRYITMYPENTLEAEYTFNKDDISFSLDFSSDYSDRSGITFMGDIYFYNFKTGEYDLITDYEYMNYYCLNNTFDLTQNSDYISNRLLSTTYTVRMKYVPDPDKYNPYDEILLPVMTVLGGSQS